MLSFPLMFGLTIYRSSAGSGKTYTLVKEYLKLVLRNPADYRHILAITFTNKATEEMKNRIINALVELSGEGNAGLEKTLCDESGLTAEEIKSQSKAVLEMILHDYSAFSVCTIDSFFHGIIRSLSREMQLPLRFDVDMDHERIVQEITSELLKEIGSNKELTEWLKQFVIFRLEDERGWNVEDEIHSIAMELFSDKLREPAAGKDPGSVTPRTFLDILSKKSNDFEEKMKRLGNRAADVISSEGLSMDDFLYKSSGVAGYLNRIRNAQQSASYVPGARVISAAEDPSKWCSKDSPVKDRVRNIVDAHLGNILSETLATYESEFTDYCTSVEIRKLFYLYGIIDTLKEKLKNYRSEKNLILMSDSVHLLRSFVTGNDTPFIYEKTGNRYKHFLVDEFQDTSSRQWDNLLPMLQNSLSEGNFAMMVGDVKQSIYRWRGGNMELLLKDVKEDLNSFHEIIKEESLDTNYRSKKNIVEFNNNFFCAASSVISGELGDGVNTTLSTSYHPESLTQQVSEKKERRRFC